jgi:hypothetical protein
MAFRPSHLSGCPSVFERRAGATSGAISMANESENRGNMSENRESQSGSGSKQQTNRGTQSGSSNMPGNQSSTQSGSQQTGSGSGKPDDKMRKQTGGPGTDSTEYTNAGSTGTGSGQISPHNPPLGNPPVQAGRPGGPAADRAANNESLRLNPRSQNRGPGDPRSRFADCRSRGSSPVEPSSSRDLQLSLPPHGVFRVAGTKMIAP